MADPLMQDAKRLHQAGRLLEAARLYQQILRRNPEHFEALYGLGMAHAQTPPSHTKRLISNVEVDSSTEDAATVASGFILYELRRSRERVFAGRYEHSLRRVEGNWKQMKGKVKEKWGNLTDDDLDKIAGRRDQLEGKIQERYGIAKDQAKKDIDTWYNTQTW